MKNWTNATIEELDVKMTAGGGYIPTAHDGKVYPNEDGVYVEEYYPVSGQTPEAE